MTNTVLVRSVDLVHALHKAYIYGYICAAISGENPDADDECIPFGAKGEPFPPGLEDYIRKLHSKIIKARKRKDGTRAIPAVEDGLPEHAE